MMQETSLLAYMQHKKSGNMNKQEQKIYQCIHDYQPINNRGIHLITNIEIGAVCGRANSLHKKQHINIANKEPCPHTGRLTIMWKINKYTEEE